MTQYTPMIQQYLKVKAEVPDALLFFRLGDFYEMFFDDAIMASRELEITLTGRGGGAEERIPMCGVPYHSAEQYIFKLIEKGHKVAICEQVEDPKEAKGVVRREIVRIVTPGTVMEGKTLGETVNNYIMALSAADGSFGLTACDLSTGELYAAALPSTLQVLMDEINVYSPAEIIGDSGLIGNVRLETAAWQKPCVFTPWDSLSEESLERHFNPAELEAVQDEAMRRSVGLLMTYLQNTQKRSLTHITRIQVYEPQHFMVLDPFTRKNLELTETLRDRSKKGSLLWLLDQTVTAMGSRLLRRWVDKPLLSKRRIEQRLEAVDVLYHKLIVREELRQALRDVYDLERLTGRITFGTANARDLQALKLSLGRVPELFEVCAGSGSQTLQQLVRGVDPCTEILGWIDQAIVDEPPVSVKDGGMIKTGYDPYLDRLKEASINGKQWIAQLEKQERESTGIKSLKIGFNKVFGYYIEVTKANLAALPEGRYERKQTLANAERYITPELKEKESLILEAEEKMVDLEYELFAGLREKIAAEVKRLQRLAETVAVMDAYQSLAAVSVSERFVKPDISEGFDLSIEEGRHPVVEAVLKDGKFIHNETFLSGDGSRILLITGPNMAGKSTYMRQVALITIMAQIGCFVPARKASIPLVDRIFTRIGAADDLVGGQSTFMVEMKDIQVMTEKATSQSLVIIDELGRGTSTGEGMSIAQAVIEFLHQQVGCKTLVSTHFHELAHLEESLPDLKNYCMAVEESGEKVTFLRKLIRGAADTSYGIYCARIAGLPESVIARAYTLLSAFEAREAGSRSGGGTPTSVVQLKLFEESAAAKDKETDRKKSPPPLDPEASAVLAEIRKLDLLEMTPMQAMNFIYGLKQRLQK